MKSRILALAATLSSMTALAQEPGAYRNFPLVISLQFHSLSLPFRDLKSNFSNLGIGIGTEVSHNGKDNWAQQFQIVWYNNKAVGNGLLFYTQSAWRPTIASDTHAEVKGGIGYLYSFRPVESFKLVNGTWTSAGKKGKGMLAIPVGVGVGYDRYSSATYVSPFLTYQFLLLKGYSQSIPLVPQTLIQAGARIHPN